MKSNRLLLDAADAIRSHAGRWGQYRVTAGFDGFVDEIISAVSERTGLKEWSPVKDISAFGDLIKAAAGRSALREIVIHRADPGGCAVNLGDALTSMGIGLDCFATLGHPTHSAFEAFAQKCRSCHSWLREPGRTLAFEFSDGKLMFSAVAQLAEFDCNLLEKNLADGAYARACAEAQVIAITDWTLYPHMTECWLKLQRDVFSKLVRRPHFFFDLVDPSARSAGDIQAMIEALRGFERYGSVVLGLNGNEANILAKIVGLPTADDEIDAVRAQAAALREKLAVTQVVTHCVKFAAGASEQGAWATPGPYCPNPKKSTGAGDRFNAGYICGLLLGLPVNLSLAVGCASSGFFVREARSAAPSELAAFLESWAAQNRG
jgi:sugar/nucleoside kinase (ribokinase family)